MAKICLTGIASFIVFLGAMGCSESSGTGGSMSSEAKADRDLEGLGKVADLCQMDLVQVLTATNRLRDQARADGESFSMVLFVERSLELIRDEDSWCDTLESLANGR